MAVSLNTLGIEHLRIEERLALVEAQRAELDRRIAEHDANPDDVVPWEEIRVSIIEHLKK